MNTGPRGRRAGRKSARLSSAAMTTLNLRNRPAIAVADAPSRVIEPRATGVRERVRELWRSRRMVRFFGRRFIEKSFLRTWLGRLWLPLRPILDVGSKILIFGLLLNAPSDGVPYAVFFLIGQSAWIFFSTTLYWMTRSVELNKRYLRHVYVPRLMLLASALAFPLVNLVLYGILTAGVLLYFWIGDGALYLAFGVDTLLAPTGLLLMTGIAAAIGFFTSVLGAQARDVRFMLSYVLGFWMLLSPVIYPLSSVPESARAIASLNPAAAPLEMIRFGLIGEGTVTSVGLISTGAFIAVVGALGLRFFARSESAALDRL